METIEKGINPATRINCDRGPVKVNGASIYNYGQQNYGTLSIADAIAVSSNTGFVRLSYVDSEKSGITPESIVAMQERLGLRGGKLVNYPTADKLPAGGHHDAWRWPSEHHRDGIGLRNIRRRRRAS